ncbi:MAG: tRNA epoxyqueuosine(34) reductase QueG [Burkholderiales bacterium]|nr:tRNA epoxyqueuosine(34) reductase QueG [Burkholderiales bacterium]
MASCGASPGPSPRPDAAAGPAPAPDGAALVAAIRDDARALGFDRIGVAGIDLRDAEPGLQAWLDAGFAGAMQWMHRHGMARARPAQLVPGTASVISARLGYFPAEAMPAQAVLDDPDRAYVSRYALGRDYHKVMRTRLQRLADAIAARVGPFGHRVFTDSAPVLEVELAARAGLGWRGKHTLLLERDAGSWFFLGEIYVSLALPADAPTTAHCGTCTRCIDACPTGAIVAPWRLDARRCLSYLTIEHPGPIPTELRPALGNRVYGCDDCQLVCPFNRDAPVTRLPDFAVRGDLDRLTAVDAFAWTPAAFADRMAGSAIRRIGHERWSRNVAVVLGNAPTSPPVLQALEARRDDASALVREHVGWALARHAQRRGAPTDDATGQSPRRNASK